MLRLFNTFTKKKEIFKSLEKGKVSMYNCGPTVYGYAHIGNFSSYLMADLLRRYLEYLGYKVRQIKNITDVGHLTSDADTGEDKLEKAAREERKDPYEIARFYEKVYLEDEKKLHILEPEVRPRATEHVKEMIEMVEVLTEKGYAYETNDGIYFDISKKKDYGKLSGNTLESLLAGQRVKLSEEKKHPADFALWKKLVGENKTHIMKWESPWGPGFPGWHIECSAMSRKYLGDQIDIHTGGEDNIFPHHECEIAQSEGFSGKKFVNYWVHKSFFHIDNEKMAKSKGNVYTLKDIEDMGYNPLDFRFLMQSAHYRSRLNFSKKSLDDAKMNRQKIINCAKNLKRIIEKGEEKSSEDVEDFLKIIDQSEKSFEKSMSDDLNVSAALASIFDFLKKVNDGITSKTLRSKDAKKVLKFLDKVNEVLVFYDEKELEDKKIPREILDLAEKREKSRKEKDFEEADRLRDEITAKGYEVRDNSAGYEVVKF